MSPRPPIHVLVVDDSALVRQTMISILQGQPGLRVTVAANALIAARKMAEDRPTVMVLDLEMPQVDGLSFLNRIMAEDPLPVIICSGFAERGSLAAMQALEAGAVEVIAKPRLGVREFIEEEQGGLLETIRAAAQARVRRRAPPLGLSPRHTADAVLPRASRAVASRSTQRLVAVGASTGGVDALRLVLEKLPAEAPAMLVVQHMPERFTAAFARRLDTLCRMEVKEAADGDAVLQGRVLIAPGNKHLIMVRDGSSYAVEVRAGALVSRHRPSADVLFRSVAIAAGAHALGVIMTGMGDDGAAGLLELRAAGARTLAQDEESCVVYGMPKEAVARGAVEAIVQLDALPAEILKWSSG